MFMFSYATLIKFLSLSKLYNVNYKQNVYIFCCVFPAGLKRMRSSIIGWYNLTLAQLKMHKYSDSAISSSQGTVSLKTTAHMNHS